MTVYRLCPSCSVAASNADTSHLDADDELAVSSWLEAVGVLAPVGQQDEPGYWGCDCCDAVQIGEPSRLWEPA